MISDKIKMHIPQLSTIGSYKNDPDSKKEGNRIGKVRSYAALSDMDDQHRDASRGRV